MPELPDITVYLERLAPRVLGQPLQNTRVLSPFLVRTAQPPLSALHGRPVRELRRIGKRIVFGFGHIPAEQPSALGVDDELFMVLHLMISGRLRWRPVAAPIPRKLGLCAFDFPTGTLLFTEASSHKRASLHVLQGAAQLRALDPGGLELLGSSLHDFSAALTRDNHTLKRALTDPRILSGIGNAYSDEILHRAKLSPVKLTHKLDAAELARLHAACITVLGEWTERLRQELGPEAFPEQVTAFREGMAVHGRYGKPCPTCNATVQRIVYAKNETNYCPRCQNQDRLLADRSLSRLLKDDWPKTLTELEERQAAVPRSGRRARKA